MISIRKLLIVINGFFATCSIIGTICALVCSIAQIKFIGIHLEIWHFFVIVLVGAFFIGNQTFLEKSEIN